MTAGVDHAQRLGLVVEYDHRQHRAEDLLARDGVAVLDLVKHGGLDVGAALNHLGSFSAQFQPRALRLALVGAIEHGPTARVDAVDCGPSLRALVRIV